MDTSSWAALRLVCHDLSASEELEDARVKYASLARSYEKLASDCEALRFQLVRSWAAHNEALLRLCRDEDEAAFWEDLATRVLVFLRRLCYAHPFTETAWALCRWTESRVARRRAAKRIEIIQI